MILKQCNAFILPVIYKNSYDELCMQLMENAVFRELHEMGESELHPFLNHRFWKGDNPSCRIFQLDANHGKELLVSLYDTKQKKSFRISELKIYLFKTGLLFLIVSTDYGKNNSPEEILERNTYLKDTYIHHERFLILDKELKLCDALNKDVFENTYGTVKIKGEPDENGIVSVSLSTKEATLDVYARLFKNQKENKFLTIDEGFFVKKNENILRVYKKQSFSLSYIVELLTQKLGILCDDYFSSSENNRFLKKAFVFNSFTMEEHDADKAEEYLFYLSHGYGRKYQYDEKCCSNYIRPFKNSYWSITREGISNINLVSPDDKNSFFMNSYEERFMTIYLWIYVLVLHQSFGLRYMTCRILKLYQNSVEAETSKDKNVYSKLLDEMENVKQLGDLFLLEYVFSDVSQITHQNEIFKELWNVFQVERLIEDYKNHAAICEDILNQKNQRKLQKKINIIAWASGIFAFFTAVTESVLAIYEIGAISLYLLYSIIGVLLIATIVYWIMQKKK